MQFPVPQFIDIEDKIIGPFTLKQFGFIFCGGLLDVLFFKTMGLSLFFFVLAIPITLATIFFSFGSYNGKPVYDAVPIFLRFLTAPKRMVFHHQSQGLGDLQIAPITADALKAQLPKNEIEEPAHSRLQKLALSLDQRQQEESDTLDEYNSRGKKNG